LWQAAANAVLVQQLLHGCKVLSFVTWSLSYELAWYALASAWFFASARVRIARSWLLLVGVLAACYAAHALGPPRLDGIGLEVPNLARFAGFFFGFAVGRLRGEQPLWFTRVEPALRALALPSVVAVLALRYLYIRIPEATRTGPAFECVFYGALDLAFAIAMAGTLAGRGLLARLLARRPLQWLGGVSYSFYLVHALYGIPVGAAIAARLALGAPLLAPPLARMAVGWALGFAATCAIAAFLFAFLEAPYFRRPARASDPT
jgi:peptidoglycan/LPS O-acetylase OafA/YrhL